MTDSGLVLATQRLGGNTGRGTNGMDTWLAVASKRDWRSYADRPVPEEGQRRILDAGRLSGSSVNKQPWLFVVVESEEAKARVAETVYAPGNIRSCAFAVAIDGVAASPDAWPGQRSAQLVQLLALADGHRLPREQVIDTLWPRLEPGAGGANLRKAAHHARQALGIQDAVVLQGGQVILRPSQPIRVDAREFERLADPHGPTGGKILRPSDGKEPKKVAFVQCAGSRDENHLPYCSYICCMASLKETLYLLEQYPDASAEIFYIDMRTPGTRYEKFYWDVKSKANVKLTKGKVAKISQAEGTDDVVVVVEDIFAGKKVEKVFDMAVLAVGMEPSTGTHRPPLEINYTPEGLIRPESLKPGIYAVGSAKSPLDVAKSVQDATGAALKSIQSLVRR